MMNCCCPKTLEKVTKHYADRTFHIIWGIVFFAIVVGSGGGSPEFFDASKSNGYFGNDCVDAGDDSENICIYRNMVYRAGLALSLLYALVAITVSFCTKEHHMHPLWWVGEIFITVGLFIGFLWVQNDPVFKNFAEIARILAYFGLVLQGILLVSLSNRVVEYHRKWQMGSINPIAAIILLAIWTANICGLVYLFNRHAGCAEGLTFVVLTLVFGVILCVVSVAPQVKHNFLAPSIMFGYYVYLCWYALRSHNPGDCNPNDDDQTPDAYLAMSICALISVLVLLLVIAYGTDFKHIKLLLHGKKEVPVPEGGNLVAPEVGIQEVIEEESKFRRIFFLIVLIFFVLMQTMNLTSWGSPTGKAVGDETMKESMWLKILSQWTLMLFYARILWVSKLQVDKGLVVAQSDPDIETPSAEDEDKDDTIVPAFEDEEKDNGPFYGGYYAEPPDAKDAPLYMGFKYLTWDEVPLFCEKHKSLMSKVLTPELFKKLQNVKSNKGYTLSNAIQTGVITPHLGVGCTAGDEECWETFKDLYYPIIKGWHGYDAETQTHPMDLDFSKLVFPDDQAAVFDKYVKSTRIRAARNISGFSLPAGATAEDRAGVEKVLQETFAGLDGELEGTYYKLGELTPEQSSFLLEKGFLFQIPSAKNLLTGAGAARAWPNNRGIFHNEKQTALAWVNEEDHCRIISMEDGGNIPSVFKRFCLLSNSIKASAEKNGTELMWNEKLGFLGTCPSNLGTGLRASVMVVLPEFNKLMEGDNEVDRLLLDEVCSAYDLQPRGSAGEHSAAVGGKFDVSNKQRLGFSEVQLVQKMIDGVSKVIEFEEILAANAANPQNGIDLIHEEMAGASSSKKSLRVITPIPSSK